MSRDDPPELTLAIRQLREVLASERPLAFTAEYLVRLQNALEVAERAVRSERLNREADEFRGE
jgi:hypothetical protein